MGKCFSDMNNDKALKQMEKIKAQLLDRANSVNYYKQLFKEKLIKEHELNNKILLNVPSLDTNTKFQINQMKIELDKISWEFQKYIERSRFYEIECDNYRQNQGYF
jgi:hypothetical protein